jgi:hypothetical protein
VTGTAVDVAVPVEPVFYEAAPVVDAPAAAVPLVELPERAESEPVEAESSAPVKRPWEREWKPWHLVAAIAAALLVGVVIGRITSSSSNNTNTTATGASASSPAAGRAADPAAQPVAGTPEARTPANASAAPVPTTAPVAVNGHAVLLNIPRHTGPLITDHFTVTASRWVLGWAYDCTAQGGTGSFNVTVFDGSGGPSKDGGIDQQGTKGSSVVAYTSTGERYLSVTTNCVWAIRVTT